VAMDAHGGAMVAYVKSPRFDDRRVSAQRYLPGRGWQPPQVLGTDGRDPKVALDRDGNALVVWSGGDRRLHGRWFRVREEVWEPEQAVPGSEDVAGTGFAISVGPAGHALAVWSRWTPSGDDDAAFAAVMASRFTAGGRWPDAVSIQRPSPQAADGWPSLAMDAGGNAIAVWAETDGTSVSIWANRLQVR
jgi:hypothetical protein